MNYLAARKYIKKSLEEYGNIDMIESFINVVLSNIISENRDDAMLFLEPKVDEILALNLEQYIDTT